MLSSEFKAVAVESLSPNSRYFCSSCCVIAAFVLSSKAILSFFSVGIQRYLHFPWALFHQFWSDLGKWWIFRWKNLSLHTGRCIRISLVVRLCQKEMYVCVGKQNHLTHWEEAIIAFLGALSVLLHFCTFIAFPWRSHFGFESFFIEVSSHWLSKYVNFMWGLITQVGSTMSVLSCFA